MPDWRQRSPLWEQSVVPSEQFTRPKHWEEHRVLKYVHAFGAQPSPVHNVAAPEKPKMTQLELAQLPGAGSQLAQVAVEATQYWVERHWAQMDLVREAQQTHVTSHPAGVTPGLAPSPTPQR